MNEEKLLKRIEPTVVPGKENHYVIVAPSTTDEHGRTVQSVFKTTIHPENMTEAQRAQF